MNGRIRKATFGALLVVFASGTVLALDFGVRQFYLLLIRKAPPVTCPSPRTEHFFYHHGFRPNTYGIDHYGPLANPYYINSMGLRDEKTRDLAKDSKKFRILFLGDSFTEGIGMPWEKSFVGILAKKMDERGVEILNGGVSSYSPTTEKAKLRFLLEHEKIHVDMVVLCIDISDIKDELFYDETRSGGVQSIRYGPLQADAERLEKIDRICGWLESKIEKNFVLLGAVSRNLRLWYRNHGPALGIRAFEQIKTWADNWPDYAGPYEDFINQGLAKAKRQTGWIADYLDLRGIPLILVIYPRPEQILSNRKPSRAEVEWLGWAGEKGLTCLSLFSMFNDAGPAKAVVSKYYIPGDCHWNEQGNRKVAEWLFSQLGKHIPANR